MRRAWLSGILLLGWLASPGALAASAREAVQAAYDKTCQAVELKYVDGLLSVRARDFEAFSPDGTRVDLGGERTRYQRLLAPAISAKKTVTIEGFRQPDPEHAVCEVHEVIKLEVMDAETRRLALLLLDSRSTDAWILTAGGWRLRSSHVSSQSFQKQLAEGPESGSSPHP